MDTDECIKKMCSIYAKEYYSVIRKNEVFPLATTWMNLKGIRLSKIIQKKKDKCHMIIYRWNLKITTNQ